MRTLFFRQDRARIRRRVTAGSWLTKLAGMAYDPELAERIRQLMGDDPALSERKMFGGLAFLISGNITITARGQGGVMVWVGRGTGYARSLPRRQ